MKTKLLSLFISLAWLSGFDSPLATVFAQGKAFTYQGRLNNGSTAANGSYDFLFTLYDATAGGNDVGGPQLIAGVLVSNGLFTATIDFGGAYNGSGRWLEIFVRTNAGPVFTPLVPRQQLTPAPYAITAGNVISGSLAAGTYGNAVTLSNVNNSFSGSFAGNGASVANVNAAELNGLTSAGFWRTNGNAGANPTNGAFLGTTDLMPLDFQVNGTRALRLEPNTNGFPNVIGGAPINHVDAGVIGATIGGGGGTNGGNSIYSDYGTISGGTYNQIGNFSRFGVIGGGGQNGISGGVIGQPDSYATISGGYQNQILSDRNLYSTIGGGQGNFIGTSTSSGTIGGGVQNWIFGHSQNVTISGGSDNQIGSLSSGSAIGGGSGNSIGIDGGYAGGSTIAGGMGNVISNADCSTIPGGCFNLTSGNYSFAAGQNAKAINDGAFVWADSSGASFASTGNNQFLIRASGGVGIGKNNPATALDVNGTVTAGAFSGDGSSLSGVSANNISSGTVPDARLSANVALRAGGNNFTGNQAITSGSLGIGTPAPGTSLHISGYESRLRLQSTNSGSYAATEYVTDNHVWHTGVGGSAVFNQLNGKYYIFDANAGQNRILIDTNGNVGIGTSTPAAQTTISGNYSANNSIGLHVLGTGNGGAGLCLEQQGVYSWGIGMEPSASRLSFSSNRYPGHSGGEVVSILANGNVGIGTTSPGNLLVVGGSGSPAYCNGTTWVNGSDRNSKESFAAINPRTVLEKVTALPITEWKYKVEADGTKHLGPVAQDFHAAFGLNGSDDKHIATVDEEAWRWPPSKG